MFLIILFTIISILLVSIFLFFIGIFIKKKNKINKQIQEISDSIEEQNFLSLIASRDRLSKHKLLKKEFELVSISLDNLLEQRNKFNDLLMEINKKIAEKKLKKDFFKDFLNEYKKLLNEKQNLKNKINEILNETNINSYEYQNLVSTLNKATKIYEERVKKYSIKNSYVENSLKVLARQNGEIKNSLVNNDFKYNQILIKNFKQSILKSYKLINSFIEIYLQVHKVLPKKIDTIKKTATKNIFDKYNDYFQKIENNLSQAVLYLNNGYSDKAKNNIKQIYKYLAIIKNEEIQHENIDIFIKKEKKKIENLFLKFENDYITLEKFLNLSYKNSLIQKNLDVTEYKKYFTNFSKEIKNLYLQINFNNSQEQILYLRSFLMSLKNFYIEHDKFLEILEIMTKEKKYYIKLLEITEIEMINLDVQINQENLILSKEELEVLEKLRERHDRVILLKQNIDDDFEKFKKEVWKYFDLFSKMFKHIKTNLAYLSLIKSILKTLNAHRTGETKLNANIKYVEKSTLEGNYKKAIYNFSKYIKGE